MSSDEPERAKIKYDYNPTRSVSREIRCPFCGVLFADVTSKNDHIFFCRVRHEREGGVQE